MKSLCGTLLALSFFSGPVLVAQVHYREDGFPWSQRASAGPDAEVDGWYYNLGITGLRVQWVEDASRHLLVRHVFRNTPAHGKVRVGDVIVGVGGRPFQTEHRNGYGMDRFGPDGPIREFAETLQERLSGKKVSVLELTLEREGQRVETELRLGSQQGGYGPSFPADCAKTKQARARLLDLLVEQQRDDGSWGSPVQDTFAPLALLSSSASKHRKAVERNARYHARTTRAHDDSALINWRYTSAAIVLSEVYLAKKQSWLVPELQEIYDFLISSQYVDLAQINPKVKESHPGSWPRDALDSHGGWGHNPGFEGYGPICMLTAQGALALALLHRCGIEVDPQRHAAAYAFLERGTGANGYVWYEDSPAGDQNWADMGRTGAAGVAQRLHPFADRDSRRRALAHAQVIGEHPQSFPDTHGSPLMGMAFTALGAFGDAASFRKLMDANRWWFVLAECPDGSFYYQPNRDNAGYGADSRLAASAVTAFIFSIPESSLVLVGRAGE